MNSDSKIHQNVGNFEILERYLHDFKDKDIDFFYDFIQFLLAHETQKIGKKTQFYFERDIHKTHLMMKIAINNGFIENNSLFRLTEKGKEFIKYMKCKY